MADDTVTLESIAWRGTHVEMPDDDSTVLIYMPQAAEPVWLGWHDDNGWHDVGAAPLGDSVTHWAEMPKGADV